MSHKLKVVRLKSPSLATETQHRIRKTSSSRVKRAVATLCAATRHVEMNLKLRWCELKWIWTWVCIEREIVAIKWETAGRWSSQRATIWLALALNRSTSDVKIIYRWTIYRSLKNRSYIPMWYIWHIDTYVYHFDISVYNRCKSGKFCYLACV